MLDNYEILPTGVIKQINVIPFTYDKKYVKDRYDKYGVQCDMISYLRYGFIVGSIGREPTSVLDVGYGNGSFLKICQQANVRTYGTDISNYPLKHGDFMAMDEIKSRHFELITFFDSLEHFHDLDFIKELKCEYICISVPNCDYNDIKKDYGEKQADDYFRDWKHRRENEHIWHFDILSLGFTMAKFGYEVVNHEYIEDIIRKPTSNQANILTAIFKRTTV